MDLSLLHELVRVLLVHHSQRAQVRDQEIKQRRLHTLRRVADHRMLRQHNLRSSIRVHRQQTPVNVTTITQIRVIAVLSHRVQNVLHQLLRVVRTLQEQLHRSRQQRQLHVRRFIIETIQERLQKLV